jgi:transcription elongation factor GreA
LEVEEKLHHAKIIEQTSSKDTVEIGGTITIETGGANRTFTIVGPTEAEPTAGKISHESPLGSAFLGKRVGDEVEVETPGGTRKYTIQNIA